MDTPDTEKTPPTGTGWLTTLGIIFGIVIVVYFGLHLLKTGTDHKTLDTTQLANIDNILSGVPDPVATPAAAPPTAAPTGTTTTTTTTPPAKTTDISKDTVALKNQREKRDQMIFAFFRSEYNGQIADDWFTQLDKLLLGLDNKDTKVYLTTKPIIVKDFFWFVGSGTYAEVLLWALVGVLVSLIYYVSLSTAQRAQDADEQSGDIGPFDPTEISGQVAKMFYAPICALVLVLGYSLLNSDNKMTDISIGKGLLLFSFLCGFFSGRVMKFIDRLKELVLPVSSTSSTGAASNKNNGTAANVTVSLQLTPALAQSADGPDITEGGFNTAVVTLQPAAGGAPITLTAPTEDQGGNFTAKQAPLGKYTLKATMAYKNATTVINLLGSEPVEVTATATSFQLQLDKTKVSG